MRIILVFILLICSAALKAQAFLPLNFANPTLRPSYAQNIYLNDSSAANKNWFVSKYGGVSTIFSVFNGGNATVVAVPLTLQLNRRLNNNLYAFAGVSATPAYVNFNQTFLATDANKGWQNKNSFNSNSFGMYVRAEMGLTYVNDSRTFSISGSISVEQSSYPVFPSKPDYSRPKPVTNSNR